jgi:hypothetical protein
LGVFSSASYGDLRDFVRIERVNNLFYDENLRERIKIRAEDFVFVIEFSEKKFSARYKWHDEKEKERSNYFEYNYKGVVKYHYSGREEVSKIFKFYKFEVLEDFPNPEFEFLYPPSGTNLLAILKTHRELKKLVKLIFDKYGLKVVLKPQENKIEVQKEVEEDIVI